MKTLRRERDKTELLDRLGSLRHDTARRWGSMSAHQMVCHLSDGYRILTTELTVKPVRPPLPRPVMKAIALYAPFRWPPGVPTTAELDQAKGSGTRPITFDADIADLRARIDQIGAGRMPQLATLQHPIFGRMSESSWLRWAYLHADHHFRQFGI